jgi:hypothetical protein
MCLSMNRQGRFIKENVQRLSFISYPATKDIQGD